jgi:hypothetical protein
MAWNFWPSTVKSALAQAQRLKACTQTPVTTPSSCARSARRSRLSGSRPRQRACARATPACLP